jgi:hypothetical protein
MCELSGNVETFLEARRYKVGALKPGRMQRVERANVLESMLVCHGQSRWLPGIVWVESSFNRWCCTIRGSQLLPQAER